VKGDEIVKPEQASVHAGMGLFVELGEPSQEEIAALKDGAGPLLQQIREAIDRCQRELGIDPLSEVVPVVLLYQEDSMVDFAQRKTGADHVTD
jgi:hypothetical protein